jgi:hypothetical protein
MGINEIAEAEEARRLYRLLQPYFLAFGSDNIGTFLPAYAGSSTPGTWTYNNRAGFYTRASNRCLFNLSLVAATRPGAPAGTALITGLPFTSNSTALSHGPVTIDTIDGFTLSGTIVQLTARIPPGAAYIELIENNGTAPSAAAVLAATGIGAAAIIRVSGHYMIG